jgi:hypothetical protein
MAVALFKTKLLDAELPHDRTVSMILSFIYDHGAPTTL